MTERKQCPRCGREIEGDFCSNCDLHFTKHGVYRTPEEKEEIAKQAAEWMKKRREEQMESLESEVEQQFNTDESTDKPFSKEVFNRTVGEVLAEQDRHISETEQALRAQTPTVTEAKSNAAEDHFNEETQNEEDYDSLVESRHQAEELNEIDSSNEEQIAEANEDLPSEMSEEVAAAEEKMEADDEPLIHNSEPTEDEAVMATAGSLPKDDDAIQPEPVELPTDEEIQHDEEQKSEAIPEDYQPAEEIHKPELADEDRPVAKQKKMNQKHVIWFSIAIIVLALLIGGGFTYYQHRQAQLAAATKEQKAITAQIDSFYVDHNSEKGFLAKTVTREKTQSIRDRIDQLAKTKPEQAKTLDKELATVQSNQELMDKVNDLFVSTKIEKDKVLNPALKADQKIQLVAVKQPKTAFDRAINDSIKDAHEQQKQMDEAKAAIAKVYANNTVPESATKKEYEAAKEAVTKVQNKALKDNYETQLKEAKEVIDKRDAEKKAKEKAEKEAAFAKETASERRQAQKITGDTRYEDVTDSSSAWDWAPGVKDKVINTCIQRGYVTKDGYVLRKAYAINGEGYYNLYGTNNHSSLLSGYKESDLPKYLVTINCKTGWFKGGAAN